MLHAVLAILRPVRPVSDPEVKDYISSLVTIYITYIYISFKIM